MMMSRIFFWFLPVSCLLFLLGPMACGNPTPASEPTTNESTDTTERVAQESVADTIAESQSEPATEPLPTPESAPADAAEPPLGPDNSNEQSTPEPSSPDAVASDAVAPDATTQETPTPDAIPPEPTPEGCATGTSKCGTMCVDLQTDAAHCGKCGQACKATQGCFAGRCLTTSKLWGRTGEKFDPTGRLMDWSYAGYEHGDKPLPTRKATIMVTAHGAIADDGKDDTAAFEKALAALPKQGGVLGIPAGTFVLNKKLQLLTNVVLQGAGSTKTILSISKSLTDVYGNKGLDQNGTSSYSFSGAFIEARGSTPKTILTTITAGSKRGSNKLQVQDVAKLKVGQWVLLTQIDSNRTLMNRLHADLMKAGDDNVGDTWTFPNQISAISGNTVTLARDLPLDVETRWQPALRDLSAMPRDIGVEHLSIVFPATTYPGHFKEKGYNAIDFSAVQHSWVRDVEILNADYGVNVRTCYNVTVSGVKIIAKRPNSSLHGHHAINVGHGADNLIIGFDIDATFVHDLTVEWYSTGNVFTKGKGRNLRMDHHRAAPYTTLWTELNLGLGTTAWTSGGRSDRGPQTAAYSTYWNLRAATPMKLPSNNYGPRMNFIGFDTTQTTSPSSFDWWLEAILPQQLGPPNLWEAMRRQRLGTP